MTKARKGGKTRRGGNRKRKGGFLAQFQKALAPYLLFQVNEMQKKKKKGGRKSRRGGRKSRRGGAAFTASSGCAAYAGEDEEFKPTHCQSKAYKASLRKGGKRRRGGSRKRRGGSRKRRGGRKSRR